MFSKEEAKKFLSDINPFVEKVQDITDKVSKLSDNTDFRESLGTMGTIGGLINIGLFLFDSALSHLSTTEQSCYSLMNKTALDVANKLIAEKPHVYKITLDEGKTKETMNKLMKIYSFKETNEDEYRKWDGMVPYDHPVVKQFKENIINILQENKLDNQYSDFQTRFDIQFNKEIKQSDIFLKYQKEKELENLKDERSKYCLWILRKLDKPNPIDNRKATDYYIKNRTIELDIKDDRNPEDNWNISDDKAESLYDKDKEWNLEDFLNSGKPVQVIAARFGAGKTCFAKIIAQNLIIKSKEMKLNDTWIPIYISLKRNLVSEYNSLKFDYDLNNVIKPIDEKVLLICDGLDEYPNTKNIESLIYDDLLNIRLKNPDLKIAQLKIIFTTNLEPGLPEKLQIDNYVRLLPFSPEQVNSFFKKYDPNTQLNFEVIKKYLLDEEKNNATIISRHYDKKSIKPLFCWMFAYSYDESDLIKTNVKNARLDLYSTFIHSILKWKQHEFLGAINNKKWVLRKIAALKSMFGEIYKEDLPTLLNNFVDKKNDKVLNSLIEEDKAEYAILTYDFKSNNQKISIDFLHKSFQEYLLAEYYVEGILEGKGYRLNVGRPSSETIDFLSSLLDVIREYDKKENPEIIKRIVRSFDRYKNQDIDIDKDFDEIALKLKTDLMDNALKIFEENKIIYSDLDDTTKSELWKEKDISTFEKAYENYVYKAISLFVIKHLDKERNPISLYNFIQDSHNILPTLRYFPFATFSGTKLLAGTNLSGAILSGTNLISANLSEAILSGTNLAFANLLSAILDKANLAYATLISANLAYATLISANLAYATLISANLAYATLISANLSNATLISANLYGAILSEAILSGTNLSFANLSGAILSGTNLSFAKLTSANLTNAKLTSANLTNAKLLSASLTNANLSNATLSGTNLSNANLLNASLTNATLSGTILSGANLSDTILLNISDTNFQVDNKTDFTDALIDNEDFLNSLINKIRKENLPKVVKNRDELTSELKNRRYSDELIEAIIQQSKFR